mmetsp:Transcript_6818/g.18900  ORF Transcript_6818/g.18900 Transcript_6818/m.18900 type:complete len:223 (+) Transcript_6818:3409-4077(+)
MSLHVDNLGLRERCAFLAKKHDARGSGSRRLPSAQPRRGGGRLSGLHDARPLGLLQILVVDLAAVVGAPGAHEVGQVAHHKLGDLHLLLGEALLVQEPEGHVATVAAAGHLEVLRLLRAITVHIVTEQEGVMRCAVELVDVCVHALALEDGGSLEGGASVAPVQQGGRAQPVAQVKFAARGRGSLLGKEQLTAVVGSRQVAANHAETLGRPALEVLQLSVSA